MITTESKVGDIVAAHPLAARVFARHAIDFCCGGGEALAAVCEARGLEAAAVLAEIQDGISGSDEPEKSWTAAPLGEVIDHILVTFHEPLLPELARIEGMARKVHEVHGDKDPEKFAAILNSFLALKADLEPHLQKEEQILFPAVRQGHGAQVAGPVSVMEAEHEAAGALLRELRRLTDDYVVPAEACNTWRALWAGLEELEKALHLHIHLENNVLFPRALRGEPA